MEQLPIAAEDTSEDIDINTKEGLQAFLRYTEEAYEEILAAAKEHSTETIHEQLQRATEMYDSQKARFDTAFEIKENDEHIDESLTNELQEGYNALLELLDAIEAGESASEVIEAEVEAPNETPVEEALIVDESTQDTVEAPVVEEILESEEPVSEITETIAEPEITVEPEPAALPKIVVPTMVVSKEKIIPITSVPLATNDNEKFSIEKESTEAVSETETVVNTFSDEEKTEVVEPEAKEVVETPLVVDEGKEVEGSELTELKEKAEVLIEHAEAMLDKYHEINEVVSSDAVLNVGQHYYKQLAVTAERTRSVLKHISEHTDKNEKVTELFREHTEDALGEIEDNLAQLEKGLRGFFDVEKEIETPKTISASLEVAKEEVEEKETVVPIVLVKKPEPVPVPKKTQPAIYNETIKPAVERSERPLKGEWGATIEKILQIPRYKNFVSYTFSSPVHFEAMMRREIHRIEAPSKFDSVLGIAYKSPFHDFFRTMTIQEIVAFDDRPREVVRAEVQEKDMKYEVYLDWIDTIQPMLQITKVHPTITFGELFVRAELETLIQHEESLAA